MYVKLKGYNKPAVEPLWTPSFIEKGTWGRAVSKFPTFGKLDQNVEKYLLPEMDEYIQSISDEELAAITRDFLIGQGVLNTPVAQHKGIPTISMKMKFSRLIKAQSCSPMKNG